MTTGWFVLGLLLLCGAGLCLWLALRHSRVVHYGGSRNGVYDKHGHFFPLPDANAQGDDPVTVDADALGERDAAGRFVRKPTLDEVLRASQYRGKHGR